MWPFSSKPEKYLNTFAIHEVEWLACSISSTQYLDFLPNIRFEVRNSHHSLLASWGLKQKECRWDIWQETQHQKGQTSLIKPKVFDPFFLFTHLCFESSFENLKSSALSGNSGVTTPDLTQEGRALQWLQTSFKVLTGALEKCEKNTDQLIQASFYLGRKTSNEPMLFRAVIFNLDITALFDEDGALGVIVFDDKNLGAGSSRTPALEAKFKALKPPVLDEFIRLTHSCMKATEARYLVSKS
ncbi:MAG: hypothetical protein K2P81_12075 [Bacteriovoracaceae bacterium]|nr:hypothetical protein [Bacteriovoracaceae bacterium]